MSPLYVYMKNNKGSHEISYSYIVFQNGSLLLPQDNMFLLIKQLLHLCALFWFNLSLPGIPNMHQFDLCIKFHCFLASSEAVMKDALSNAFRSVERGYFDTIDEPLVKRLNLQIQIPEVSFILFIF